MRSIMNNPLTEVQKSLKQGFTYTKKAAKNHGRPGTNKITAQKFMEWFYSVIDQLASSKLS